MSASRLAGGDVDPAVFSIPLMVVAAQISVALLIAGLLQPLPPRGQMNGKPRG